MRFRNIVKLFMLVLLITIFVMVNKHIDDNRIRTINDFTFLDNPVYDVENIEVDGSKLVLNGWFFDQQEIQHVKREAVKSDTVFVMLVKQSEIDKKTSSDSLEGETAEMSYSLRNDVNSYFDCEYDYSHCGFSAVFDKNDINKNEVYRVFFKWNENEADAIETNLFVYKDKIYYSNPLIETSIDSNSEIINEIIRNGTLLANRRDVGFYIYQYGSKLYWIADSNAYFEEDGSTYMQYQMNTTQYMNLPSDRIQNGWYWSNIGGDFEEYELKECNIDGYRVMVRDLPKEYSIVNIWLGYYADDSWVWMENVRPCYSKLIKGF